MGPDAVDDFLAGKAVSVVERNFSRQTKTTYQLSAPVDKAKLYGTIG